MYSVLVGISATMLVLAAYLCGKDDVPVYDGAWTEWFQKAKKEHMITAQ
jgi:thiosulfate/3-mercaptopyruvate sulfurtransferase